MSKSMHTRMHNGSIDSKAGRNYWDRYYDHMDRRVEAAKRVRRIVKRTAIQEQMIAHLDEDQEATASYPDCETVEFGAPEYIGGYADTYTSPVDGGLGGWRSECGTCGTVLRIHATKAAARRHADEHRDDVLHERRSFRAWEQELDDEYLDDDEQPDRWVDPRDRIDPLPHSPYRDDEDGDLDDSEDDDLVDEGGWMPVMTLAQACENLDGFIIEGPSVRDVEPKSANYKRVWELAREVGIESRDMLTALAREGEWVSSHQSFVPFPVCERLKAQRDFLVLRFGARKAEPVSPGMALLNTLLAEEARSWPRRPVNPFHRSPWK